MSEEEINKTLDEIFKEALDEIFKEDIQTIRERMKSLIKSYNNALNELVENDKKIDKLQKTIDLMATELSRRPLMIYLDNERDDRLVILDNPKEIIKYYTNKAEE